MCSKNCKDNFCNPASGMCKRCKNAAYLLNGRCEQAREACYDAGRVPVGSNTNGRACVAIGERCMFPYCNPGRACVEARVVDGGDFVCERCEDKTWLLDGDCHKDLVCRKGKFITGSMAGQACSCHTDNCRECLLRKAVPTAKDSSLVFIDTSDGLFAACKVCRRHQLLFEDRCIEPFKCPALYTKFDKRAHGGTCEKPFVCDSGVKLGGDNEGRGCDCLKRECMKCSWTSIGHTCEICKKSKYLLDGVCVGVEKCIEQGDRMPVRGNGPRGGICLRL
jgi:hypothetical protein